MADSREEGRLRIMGICREVGRNPDLAASLLRYGVSVLAAAAPTVIVTTQKSGVAVAHGDLSARRQGSPQAVPLLLDRGRRS